jgi:hypothetical protein
MRGLERRSLCISLQRACLFVASRFEMQQSDNHTVVKEPKTESVVVARYRNVMSLLSLRSRVLVTPSIETFQNRFVVSSRF